MKSILDESVFYPTLPPPQNKKGCLRQTHVQRSTRAMKWQQPSLWHKREYLPSATAKLARHASEEVFPDETCLGKLGQERPAPSDFNCQHHHQTGPTPRTLQEPRHPCSLHNQWSSIAMVRYGFIKIRMKVVNFIKKKIHQ